MVRVIRVSDICCGRADIYDRGVDGITWRDPEEAAPTAAELRRIAEEPQPEEPPLVYVEDDTELLADV